MPRPPIDVVFVAFDGIQTLDLTGPHDVFAGANAVLDDLASNRGRYRLTVASIAGGLVTSESTTLRLRNGRDDAPDVRTTAQSVSRSVPATISSSHPSQSSTGP